MQSLHASPQHAQRTREAPPGLEAARSLVDHQPLSVAPPPGYPLGPVVSPGVEMHSRPFGLGANQPMPHPQQTGGNDDFAHAAAADDVASRSRRIGRETAGWFPRSATASQLGPPPFWPGPGQQGPPRGIPLGQYGMMQLPQPGMPQPPMPGFMSPPGFAPPPPGMMPPPPFVGGGLYSQLLGHGQPWMPYGMAPQLMPPPFAQHGFPPPPGQGMPLPHQQQQMTHDLMNLLGSMRDKKGGV
jgi:hypothetical protein